MTTYEDGKPMERWLLSDDGTRYMWNPVLAKRDDMTEVTADGKVIIGWNPGRLVDIPIVANDDEPKKPRKPRKPNGSNMKRKR